jgi:ribosomal protein L37AE/L43A
MKKNYNFSVQLRCPVCGSTDIEITEDKTYGKCNMCNKEFHGGYDELVELNQANIQDEMDAMKAEVKLDAVKYLRESLKKAFKGNKYIKFK